MWLAEKKVDRPSLAIAWFVSITESSFTPLWGKNIPSSLKGSFSSHVPPPAKSVSKNCGDAKIRNFEGITANKSTHHYTHILKAKFIPPTHHRFFFNQLNSL